MNSLRNTVFCCTINGSAPKHSQHYIPPVISASKRAEQTHCRRFGGRRSAGSLAVASSVNTGHVTEPNHFSRRYFRVAMTMRCHRSVRDGWPTLPRRRRRLLLEVPGSRTSTEPDNPRRHPRTEGHLGDAWRRHGSPVGGGPWFQSDQFQRFADACRFLHTKSSPRYAPANGAAKRAVQMTKAMLRKADDLQMALFAYRTTPIVDGYSPAQLSTGRQLLITVSQFNLQPKTPNPQTVRQHDRLRKNRKVTYLNRRHRARNGSRWMAGERVWIKDAQTETTVTETLSYRSYQLRTASGTSFVATAEQSVQHYRQLPLRQHRPHR
jgi:hypothetical protein